LMDVLVEEERGRSIQAGILAGFRCSFPESWFVCVCGESSLAHSSGLKKGLFPFVNDRWKMGNHDHQNVA
jgi:hypothetical protein